MTSDIHEQIGCNWDEDGNGLDDEVEEEIARCLAPIFDMDPAENTWNGADEPKILWSITRTSTPSDRLADILVTYGFLSTWDGGFAADGALPGCVNEHFGDTGQVMVTAQIARGTSWYVRLESVSADKYTRHATQAPQMHRQATHPVVYPTAGKHHLYLAPGNYTYDVGCLVADCQTCEDPARGGIAFRTDQLQTFKQGMNPSVFWDGLPSDPWFGDKVHWPLVQHGLWDDGNHWLNMCALFHSGERRKANRLQPFMLFDIGVPGSYASVYAMSSVTVTPPAQIFGMRRPHDTDGDGLSELGHFDYSGDVPMPVRADDRCSLGSQQGASSDADALLGDCDPVPLFYSPYVGGGSSQYPAVSKQSTFGASFWPTGGFLDWDQDGVPVGADMCPTMPDPIQNANAWGERYNWNDWGESNVLNYKLGSFTRGDACDPYPVAIPSRTKGGQSGGSSSGMCVKPGWRTGGQDEIEIQQSASIGISHNDPRAKDKSLSSYPPPPESVWTQSFRCACRGFEGQACIENELSDCFRGNAIPTLEFTSQTAGRRWRPVDRCVDGERDEHSFCRPYRIATPYFGMLPWDQSANITWSWLDEVRKDWGLQPAPEGWINHFAPGDFTYSPAGGDLWDNHTEAYSSNVKFVLWTWMGVDVDGERYEAPGPLPIRMDLAFGEDTIPDPEIHDPELVPSAGPNESPKSRRLRSGHDISPAGMASEHGWMDWEIHFCPAFNQKYRVHVRWPEEFIRWPEEVWQPPTDVILGVGELVSQSVLLRGNERSFAAVQLTAHDAETWLGNAPGQGVPIAPMSQASMLRASYDQATSNENPFLGIPWLLWVEQSAEDPRWAILKPVEQGPSTVVYSVQETGNLGMLVSQDARLLHDQLGSSAALVDPENGVVLGFEPQLRTWIATRLPEGRTLDRDGAAMALVGSKLLAVGDEGDALQVDVLGGGASVLALALPVRKGAHLVLSGDGRELVYAGGFSDGDTPHDDAWAVEIPLGNDPWKPAHLVQSDTGTRGLIHDAGTVIAAPIGGGRLRAWSVAEEGDMGIIQPYERTGASWSPLDLNGSAQLARCNDTDAVGGRACELSDAWWATPGTTACEAAPQPGACQGVAGHLATSVVVNLPERVLSAVPDDASVWVLTQTNVIHYTLSDGAAVIQNAVKLPARGRAIAVQRNEVLLATDAGVHLVTVRRGDILIGEARPLCGRPVNMAPIGGTLWAVSTTLGLAVVSTSGSAVPTVLSMSGVVPSGKDRANAAPLPLDDLGHATCASLDRMLDDDSVAWMVKATPLAAVSSQRLLSAHGPFLVDVDISNPMAPAVRHAMKLKTVLRSLRVDDAGQFAYGTGDGASDRHRPVLDLRGSALALSGQHGLTDWVERKDGVTLAVRATSPRRVEVAKVVR